MSDTNDSNYEFRPQVGEIRGLLEVIEIATDSDSLRNWIENDDDLDISVFASGYLVFLETGIRRFVGICESNPDVRFQSDYISNRAIAQLPELSAVPHASEKLNFCRAVENIQKQLRNIGQPSNVPSFLTEVNQVIHPFRELRKSVREETTPADPSINKSQLDEDLAILSLYTYFQQTRKNRPHGYGPSNFDSWISGGPRKNAIIGYTSTLQFAWSQLLSPEEYEKASIADLTKSERWTPPLLSSSPENFESEPETSLSDFRTQIEKVAIDPIVDKYEGYADIGDVYPDDLVKLTSDASLKKQFEECFSADSTRSLPDLDPHDRVAYGLI